MKEEHRSLVAAGLSMLVLVLWFTFFGKGTFQHPPVSTTTPPAALPSSGIPSASGVTASPSPSGAAAGSSSAKPEVLTIKETPLMTLEWTNRGARLSRILLRDYRQDVKKDSPPINLIPLEGEKSLSLLCSSCAQSLPDDSQYVLVPEEAGSANAVVYRAERDGLVVQKRYEWSPDSYVFNLRVVVENKTDREFHGRLGLGWSARQFPEQPKKFGFFGAQQNQRSFLYKLGKDVVHISKKDEGRDLTGLVPWVGIEDRYFLISLISRRISSEQVLKLEHDGDRLNMALYPAEVTLPPNGRQEEQFSFYLGPKRRADLTLAGVGLEEAVDYGWFSLLAIPILRLLQIFHMGVKNWGVAVILLTLFFKILTNPLTAKSMKQMKGMQKLQPKLAALKEKYQNDRQRLNAETMALFRTHGVNPLGGCLPMALQMPIYIALYKVLYNAIELYHAPFVGFYRDLAAPDPYFILPVLLGVAMVAQQKLTPSASADPAQKQMMMIMPIMFTGFMLFLPMGLVLYIFVNTLFSVIQQWMSQRGIRWRDVLRGQLAVPPQT